MRFNRIISDAYRAQRRYFREDKLEIADENLVIMQIAGSVGAVVSGFFFIIAPIFIPSWSVTKEYICIVPILAVTFLFSFFYSRRAAAPDPRMVEVASAAFYVLLLVDFIALSVFPYPNTPQIFISLCYMFMPALMIQRPGVLIGIMLCSETVFVVLAMQHKTAFAIENDLFNTVAALVFSLIIMVTTNRLRIRNHAARSKLEKLSQTDVLTGLLNKSAFEERAAAYLGSPTATNGCVLMILDLDDFKQVNDRFGHPFGDALLAATGDALLRSFRQSDLVGRVGGDEFAVLLRGRPDSDTIAHKRCELDARFASLTVEGEPFHASCSVGVAASDDGRQSYLEMFRAADGALYEVKRHRKGSLVGPVGSGYAAAESPD